MTLALIGGALLLLLKAKAPSPPSAPAPTQQEQPPPTTTTSAPQASVPQLAAGAAAVGAAVGAVGQFFADNHTSGWGGQRGIASTIATPTGVLIGAGGFTALGGLSGATLIAGGTLPALGLIIIPAIVVTVIVLSYVQIFETREKQAKFVEYYEAIGKLISAGAWEAAWAKAVEAAELHKLGGLGFHTTAKSAIPATIKFNDGRSMPTADLLAKAYAQSQTTGDDWAYAINASIPWMCNVQRDGSGGSKLIPNGAVRFHFSPYAKLEYQAEVRQQLNGETYKRAKAELAAEMKVDPELDDDTRGDADQRSTGGY